MKVAVIGSGSWGTAIGQLLGSAGNDVCIRARRAEVADCINSEHRNPSYLRDALLDGHVSASTSYADCLRGAAAVVVVAPSNATRAVARTLVQYVGPDVPIILCAKGVEEGTGCLGTDIFDQELGNPARLAVLSGPNHAEEVVKGVPAASVIASPDASTAEYFQNLFATDTFRTYVSGDVKGVQLCAASKNVIAIGVGISYGLGFGDNTASLILTRGMAEMSRLVVACGGEALTCMGLAGAGDLVATCMSRHSRNRQLGEMLAAGQTIDDFAEKTHMVAEGALACKTLLPLAREHGVELPITSVVNSIIWEGGDVRQMSLDLLNRPLTYEMYGI